MLSTNNNVAFKGQLFTEGKQTGTTTRRQDYKLMNKLQQGLNTAELTSNRDSLVIRTGPNGKKEYIVKPLLDNTPVTPKVAINIARNNQILKIKLSKEEMNQRYGRNVQKFAQALVDKLNELVKMQNDNC